MTQEKDSATAKQSADYTVAYEPDLSLKKIIGEKVSLNEIFTPEKIAAGNKIIEESRNQFFVKAPEEIKKLSELSASTSADPLKTLTSISTIAANLKGEGEMYGFTFVQKVCTHIMETCRDEIKGKGADMKTSLALVLKLTQTLDYAVKHAIKDDGGEAGRAILADLSNWRTRKKS